MCVRWLATVRSPRKSAAATSRFVRPSATSAATRCSAAVSPLSWVRPPMRPSSTRARSTQVAAPSRSKPAERRLERGAGRGLLPVAPPSDAEREKGARMSVGIAGRLVLRDRLLEERCSPSERPRRRRAGRGNGSRARAPIRGRHERASASHTSRSLAASSTRPRLEEQSRRGRPSTSGCSAHPTERRRLARRALPSQRAPRRGLHPRGPRARAPPGAAVGGSANCSSQARALAPSARVRASSCPRWTAMTAIGRWSCGHSSPYWIEMSCACAAWSAASSQRPPQNSSQARPQSARALAARRARATPRARARAAARASLASTPARRCSRRRVSPPARAARRRRAVAKSWQCSRPPAVHRRRRTSRGSPERRAARARRSSSSSSSASSSAARACSRPAA